jgi:hypothetical protein
MRPDVGAKFRGWPALRLHEGPGRAEPYRPIAQATLTIERAGDFTLEILTSEELFAAPPEVRAGFAEARAGFFVRFLPISPAAAVASPGRDFPAG